MLWADGESFAQVIEGEPDYVGQAMDRIYADTRHTDIETLLDRLVQSRQFGSWSMRHAADGAESSHGTAFMIGFAMGERTEMARRLYKIVMATDR